MVNLENMLFIKLKFSPMNSIYSIQIYLRLCFARLALFWLNSPSICKRNFSKVLQKKQIQHNKKNKYLLRYYLSHLRWLILVTKAVNLITIYWRTSGHPKWNVKYSNWTSVIVWKRDSTLQVGWLILLFLQCEIQCRRKKKYKKQFSVNFATIWNNVGIYLFEL